MLLENPFFPALFPRDAGDLGENLLEVLKQTAPIQVSLEAGHRRLARVVAPCLVEDLDEHLQEGVGLVLVDQGRLLIDVEQQGCGRDVLNLSELALQEGILLCLGLLLEGVRCVLPGAEPSGHITQQEGEHLEQVRLTGTKETGDPHTVAAVVDGISVGLQQL